MSTTATLPPGLVPIETATSALKYMTLSAAYSGSLVVPLGLLLLYCPKPVRRTPVFPILIVTLGFGIIWAFLSFAENMDSVKYPLDAPVRGIFLGSSALNFLIPIFTDTVLIFKLLWLFPSFQYKLWQRALLVALPTLMEIPRLVVISLYLANAGKAFDSTRGIQAAVEYLATSPYPLAEFCMQLAQNTYCSIILLFKAYTLLRGPNLRQGGGTGSSGIHRGKALTHRLSVTLRVLASSFLIPVCIEIVLVGSFAGTTDIWFREPVQWSNTYVSLHCAVLATVWSSIGDGLADLHKGDASQSGSSGGFTAHTRSATASGQQQQSFGSEKTRLAVFRESRRTSRNPKRVSDFETTDNSFSLPLVSSGPQITTERAYFASPRDTANESTFEEVTNPNSHNATERQSRSSVSSTMYNSTTPSSSMQDASLFPSPRGWTEERVRNDDDLA